MKKNLHYIIMINLIFACFNLYGQDQSDTLGIIDAAKGYIGGWYEGNTDKMSNALHPCLAKRKEDYSITAAELIGFTKNCSGCSTPAEKRTIDVTITNISDSIASAKAISYAYIDYIDLAKNNGIWKIVNVLWDMNDYKGSGTSDDLLKTIQTYTQSWKDGDKDKMTSVLANHVYSRISLTNNTVENVVKSWILNEVSSCRECNKNYNYEIKILDEFIGKNATAKVSNGDSVQYLQVCSYSGVWKIVNILRNFKYNPKTNSLNNFNADAGSFYNFPNPFNEKTTIFYQLTSPSDVSIEIYDLFGRTLKSYVSNNQFAGRHEATFFGENLKSGVYLCKIITGSSQRTIKMNLLK